MDIDVMLLRREVEAQNKDIDRLIGLVQLLTWKLGNLVGQEILKESVNFERTEPTKWEGSMP